MRRGQCMAVIEFAIGGVFSVKGRPIPGSDAGFVVIGLFAGVIPDAVDLIGSAHLVDPGRGRRFCHRTRRRRRSGWRRACRQQKAKANHGSERSQKSHRAESIVGAVPKLTDGTVGCKVRGLYALWLQGLNGVIGTMKNGGWGEIRTHGDVAATPVFKTGALNRSATHPEITA